MCRTRSSRVLNILFIDIIAAPPEYERAKNHYANLLHFLFDTGLILWYIYSIIECVADVLEAFALGGTTPTINVGTSGSAGTNYGIELSEAQAEAVNTVKYDATAAGTWQSVLAADTTVAVELDGTSPTITSAGRAKVVIRYVLI